MVTSENTISVFNVADWFLSKESMTHKKLQKLCYYAQAWYYTLYGKKKLFDDRIEAWVHGPVTPTLYTKYAGRGWEKINKSETPIILKPEQLEILESVYDTYGDLTGDELENLTHNETPWKKTRGDLKPWERCTEEISLESMFDFYSNLYRESQND